MGSRPRTRRVWAGWLATVALAGFAVFLAALLAGDLSADNRESGGPGAHFHLVLAAAVLFELGRLRRAGAGWALSIPVALLAAPAAVVATGLGFALLIRAMEVLDPG